MSKIGNAVVEVPKGIELNDKDYSVYLLSTLKEMEKNYAIAMTEASNEYLYQIYKDTFDSLSSLQRELYILIFQKGWYQFESLDSNKIREKYQLFEKDYKELSE